MTSPLLYDTHMHTPLCKHAVGAPTEYAEVAERKGFKGIIFTCHSPMPNDAWSPHVRMRVDQFDEYLGMIADARAAWAGRVDVRLGIESDYAPGFESWLTELHGRAEFDYLLGSVHPQMREYQQAYYHNDAVAFYKTYYDHLAMAAETGLFNCISHPDLVKTVFPKQWNLNAVLDHIRGALDRIAMTGVAMELNTSGVNKPLAEMHPSDTILAEMCVRNIPVVIGSDSHEPKRIGADFDRAFDMLTAAGYKTVNFFLGQARQAVGIEAARMSLNLSAGGVGKRK